MKVQLFWTAMFLTAFGYQFLKMAVGRVQPKREEELFLHVREMYGDNIPREILEMSLRQREASDAWSLSNVLKTPTPGEVSGALQHELDPRNIKKLKSWNGY